VPAQEYEHCCKVGRVADRYGLSPGVGDDDLNDQLAGRWLGEGYPETALRPLVDWMHKHMLRERYTEHGRSTLEPHLESDYEALQGDDDDRQQAVLADLAADGIDGEALVNDFVSPATLYRHLTGCLGVRKARSSGDTGWEEDKIEYARERAERSVSEVLRSWENKSELPQATEAEVAVRIYLECPVCARQTSVEAARQRGYICEAHMSGDSEQPRTRDYQQPPKKRGDTDE